MKGPCTLSLLPVPSVPADTPEENPFCVVRGFLQLMERRDPFLVIHGERTAQYAMALGHAAQISERELLFLQYAALLHDLGKLTLPNEVERKALEDPQHDICLQCHPRAGSSLLQGWPALQTVAVFIAHHHERWDGYGYPYGLRSTLIPLGSRILTITDAFDKLSSPFPYGEGQSVEQAVQSLQGGSGLRFDPQLVDLFLPLIPKLIGSGGDLELKLAPVGCSPYEPVSSHTGCTLNPDQ